MTESRSKIEGRAVGVPFKPAWRMPRWAITSLSLFFVLGIWEIFGPQINPLFASYPSEILRAFWKMMESGRLPDAFLSSMQPLLVGYFLAALLGIPVGLLLGRSRVFDAAFGIYIIAGYSTPLIALIPLLMIWFGLGFTVKMVIIFLLAFFPICINTWVGVQAVPKTLLEVGTAFCASQPANQSLAHHEKQYHDHLTIALFSTEYILSLVLELYF